MAGVVLENLSWKKLIVLGVFLLILMITFFLVGGIVSPKPSNVVTVLATRCYDRGSRLNRTKWFIPRGPHKCEELPSLDPEDEIIINNSITEKQVVFSFWIPGPRDGAERKMSPLFQSMLGVLQLDVEKNLKVPLSKNPVLQLDVRMGVRDEDDKDDDWKLLASSVEDRNLQCKLDKNKKEGYLYDCELLQLFELGSISHHFYLVNIRLPVNFLKGYNVGIGKVVDMYIHVIHQNGGFTIVWVTMKSVMFLLVLSILIWFWRRIMQLGRPPNLLERTLFALGVVMSILNCPIELLQFGLNVPFMLLLNDIRQGAFYAMLMSFWVIFAGEHIMDQTERNRLSLYWKHLSAIIFGSICLFVFDMCERGIQLKNPFFSIWVTSAGTKLALAFIILAGIAAGCYFLFLCYMIFCVMKNISAKKASLPSMSQLRRKFYLGIIYRFRFLMLATLVCAAFTVIFFIISQLNEGEWRWGDHELSMEYTSAFFTGVYGMWNVYVCGLLSLYAPSHKTVVEIDSADGSTEENVQLTQLPTTPSETSALQALTSKAAQD
ncbi:protein wntless homolog [Saccostrea echinata]|uniref:protein wntless homolog n=1 Tax=Saccostrea echinata TaxID=191078 RepID=UPI002A81A09C|nr:protein wntless homolog [Saccostrea echinata]